MIRATLPQHIHGISLSELFWLDYMVDGRTKYCITSDMFRSTYYLYTVDRNGKATKTKHKSDEPTKLYKYCI